MKLLYRITKAAHDFLENQALLVVVLPFATGVVIAVFHWNDIAPRGLGLAILISVLVFMTVALGVFCLVIGLMNILEALYLQYSGYKDRIMDTKVDLLSYPLIALLCVAVCILLLSI